MTRIIQGGCNKNRAVNFSKESYTHYTKHRTLTWDYLCVSQTHYLPIQDTAPSAEGFKELRLFLVNNILHHFWVFLQLWECFTLENAVKVDRWRCRWRCRQRGGKKERNGKGGVKKKKRDTSFRVY